MLAYSNWYRYLLTREVCLWDPCEILCTDCDLLVRTIVLKFVVGDILDTNTIVQSFWTKMENGIFLTITSDHRIPLSNWTSHIWASVMPIWIYHIYVIIWENNKFDRMLTLP